MKTTNGALATLGAGTALTAAAVLDGLVVAAVLGFQAWPGAGASEVAAGAVLPGAAPSTPALAGAGEAAAHIVDGAGQTAGGLLGRRSRARGPTAPARSAARGSPSRGRGTRPPARR